MEPDDLIDGGVLRDSDLDGGPAPVESQLGPFGRYLLMEELGRGGAAVVYRAFDPLLNRHLALKRLRFGDRELEARFLREAEILARLSHSGIVPIYDFGQEGDSHYYTMPLATGLSLDRWLEERRPDAREAARIVRQAAEALAHAHERGVLHRDVKPANILVNAEGAALLADFGLSRDEGPESRETSRVTQSGEMMGTPSYVAPELATRDLKAADARCDVYSMGATLYEALTGRPPFIGKSSLEILKLATTVEPAAPRRLAPHTPADLEVICLKALEKDPTRRYTTVREMSEDLGRFLAGEPIRARRASAVYRLRQFVGRRRAILSVALIGVLVAAGLTIYFARREDESADRLRRVDDILDRAGRHADSVDKLLQTQPDSNPDVVKQTTFAMEEIDRALEVDPRSARAYFLRGRVHALLLQRDEARRCYGKAIELGPVALALLERANLDCQELIYLKGDPATAASPSIQSLRESVRRDLDQLKRLKTDAAHLEFAQALEQVTRLDQEGFRSAAEILESYVSRNRDWRAFIWKGTCEAECGEFDKARVSYEAALGFRRRSRAGAWILDRLGLMFVLKDQMDEAEKHLREAVLLDPKNYRSLANLASVLLDRGEIDDAIKKSDDALALNAESVHAHAIRGQAYVVKHQGLKDGRDTAEGRRLLKEAHSSLEKARPYFPAESEQGKLLADDWKYVQRSLRQ